jgi:SWI/SNF-related matrix-associated actin-dependent regulator 1 of chromatin subfamily A
MKVEKIGQRFIAVCTFTEKEIPKAAGFRWDSARRQWFTTDPAIAAKLDNSDALMAEVRARLEAKAEKIDESRAADSAIELPVPQGLAYLPYQRAGIATGIRRPNILFGDEMGLGKTIQAIGILNADPTLKKVLVICPASLKLNWHRELKKWLVRDMSIWIASTPVHVGMMDITIINYDILQKCADRLRAIEWDAAIIDEAHYLKSKGAKRTQVVFGIDDYAARKAGIEAVPGLKARRRIALSGTPIPNRPVEGFGLFHWLAPEEFKNFFAYAKQFCGAQKSGYGWDMAGASNLPQLQDKLRGSIMVRRLKADVLTDLPAKRRQIVEFSANGASDLVEEENSAWTESEERMESLRVRAELAKAGSKEEYDEAVSALREAATAAFTEMSKLRHETAMATVPYAAQHILQALNDGGGKIVVMAHHKDVVKAIIQAVEDDGIEAVSLTGETSMIDRQRAVDEFQTNPNVRVFVGNIQAAGVGITLTAAAHVIFVELDWVPGNMSQAEDRCHRIGQHDSVLVQHLVLEGSLSARMAKVLLEKQEVIDRALDRKEEKPEDVPVTPSRERAASEGVSRDKIGALAEKLTPAEISAIHEGLQILAGFDADHARELNGMGFSKIDVQIGHSLARCGALTARQAALGARLVSKYRRQLPESLTDPVIAILA